MLPSERGEGKEEENLGVLVWPQATAAAERQLQSGQVKSKLQKSVRVRRVLEQGNQYFITAVLLLLLWSRAASAVA